QVLWIRGDVRSGVDLRTRYVGRLERSDDIVEIVIEGPGGYGAVDFRRAPDSPDVARQFRILPQIVAADRVHQSLVDTVGVAADHDAFAIARRVSVRWDDVGEPCTDAVANLAEEIVVRQHALHHVEHRLVERDVDHLPFATMGVAVTQRHQRPDHPVQRGERIADADIHAHWRSVGKTSDVTHAAHRFADGSESGLVAIRPRLPESAK